MPLFKIAQGPWTLLLKGALQENELEVYVNPQKIVYVQIARQENGQYLSASCEFYNPLISTGDVTGFVQTLPREVLVITRHFVDDTTTFLLLGSGAVSMDWEENIVLEQTDILLKKLEVSSNLLSDIARAYDVQLKPMNEFPPKVSEAFFAMPLLVPLLSTNAHGVSGGEGAGSIPSSAAGHMGALPGEFVLGTSANGLMVKEPVLFFKKAGIFNGRVEHRKHILQVIVEGALFSNVPVVIVDWQNEFSIMRNPNPNAQMLHDQKIEGDPIGFPLKEFLAPDNLKLELSTVYPEGLGEVLGLMDTDLGQNLVRFLREHKVTSIDEAKGLLRQLPPSETLTPFQIASVIRTFSLLDQTYPGLFTGTNPIEEIAKSWFQSIGRIGILRLQNTAPKIRRLLVYTIMRGIYEMISRRGVAGRIKTLLVIPEIPQLFDYPSEPLLSREIERLLASSNSLDVGFILSAPHEIDLPKNVLTLLEAKLSVVGGREAAITLAGRKNYRVQIRDTYSQPVIKDFFEREK